jgi:hypothetical protein
MRLGEFRVGIIKIIEDPCKDQTFKKRAVKILKILG